MANAPSSDQRSYGAFLSYSHQDERWGRWLQRALESYRVPSRLVGRTTSSGVITRRLGPIFRDRSDLPTATDLGATITEALRASVNLIVICSPTSASSRWVNEETRVFRALGRGNRIFCLIVDGEPHASDMPGREAEECFAPALRFIESADGQPGGQRAEPIAADARPGADGRTNAKLKFVAGLRDVGLDELKQREQRRHYQRLAVVAALALVVMFVTSGNCTFITFNSVDQNHRPWTPPGFSNRQPATRSSTRRPRRPPATVRASSRIRRCTGEAKGFSSVPRPTCLP
jgi:hypothetical protein